MAFCRKWGKKSPVIVLSNFAAASVSNFTVDFQSCDKEMVEPTVSPFLVCFQIQQLIKSFILDFGFFQQLQFNLQSWFITKFEEYLLYHSIHNSYTWCLICFKLVISKGLSLNFTSKLILMI